MSQIMKGLVCVLVGLAIFLAVDMFMLLSGKKPYSHRAVAWMWNKMKSTSKAVTQRVREYREDRAIMREPLQVKDSDIVGEL